MNILEFRDEVIEFINVNYVGLTAIGCETIKNNGVKQIGINVRHSEEKVLPTIYLESYLEDYNNSIPLEIIVKKILEVDNNSRIEEFPDMTFFGEFNMVKDMLFLKLINTCKNDSLLDLVPHKHFMDLSMVAYCDMSTILGMEATVLVRNEHIEKWGVSCEEVIDTAYKNTRNNKICVRNIVDIIKEMMKDCEYPSVGFDIDELSSDENMLVLNNEKGLFGAICMTFDDVLDEIIGDKGAGLYIIPSSIHETILVPDTGRINMDNLNDMIKEVNLTTLSKEEILSSNGYYYSVKDGYSIV